MLRDIFSSFDPQCYTSSLRRYFVWVRGMVVCFLFLNPRLWISGGRVKRFINRLVFVIYDQVGQTSIKRFAFRNLVIVGMFILFVYLNFWGLLPYVFSPTSHLRFSFGLSFVVWSSIIVSSFVYNFYNSVARFLPGGAPWWLNPFLILIEFVRLRVRPLTLAFRLAANITAGHIVLTLIREFMCGCLMSRYRNFLFLGLVNRFYFMFEIGVRLIQAYIFCLLLTLYSNDHQ